MIYCRLDTRLGPNKIGSNELVEISGTSGSGKTYLCMKMIALALNQDICAIYIDTTNYLNYDNISTTIKVRQYMNFVW